MVFAGLSGGVDSAVSAALLKEQGFNVVGAFIKIWSPEFLECTWREDRLDAMRVCVALGIPFKEVDLSKEYRDSVVADMIEKYKAGITPNPDVLCNCTIKFGAFARWAFSQGASMIATGHYAQIQEHACKSDFPFGKSDLQEGQGARYSLMRGKDTGKDQSYFLYRLGQDDLRRVLFPVGGLHKSAVRALAKRLALPVAEKPDSQGLCFVGDVTLRDFLGRFIELRRGSFVNVHGTVVGMHDGAALYTIGQRHGINVPGGPHFVTRIDAQNNIVEISPRREDVLSSGAILKDVHWIESEPTLPLRALAQPRYHAQPIPVSISKNEQRYQVQCDEPQLLSPGQSLVLYDNERCLGGGLVHSRIYWEECRV